MEFENIASLKNIVLKKQLAKITIATTQKTSKKSANADFFLTQTSICDFIQKKLCAIFDNHHRSGNDVGGSFKVSLWHTPTPA